MMAGLLTGIKLPNGNFRGLLQAPTSTYRTSHGPLTTVRVLLLIQH